MPAPVNISSLFFDLLSRTPAGADLAQDCWREIERAYTASGRFYHTLSHLEEMIQHLQPVRSMIVDYDALLWAVFYHDIVYKIASGKNELRSAWHAVQVMQRASVDPKQVKTVYEHIVATQAHLLSGNGDTNFLLDADLAILGQEGWKYALYAGQVRREYKRYPDFLYKPGRSKVLQSFLSLERIFKTEYFFQRLERQARKNLQQELATL